jgi:tRNA pseudouridine55 synthase
MFDGILIIDKPAGITSHDVVARCRRILKTKRIGHTGTLDPFATGVMVVLVGKATRLAQFLDRDAKEYEALVRFGFETDTGDRTGSPKSQVSSSKSQVPSSKSQVSSSKFQVSSSKLQVSDFKLGLIAEIANVLPEFRGAIEQTPPMYSAKKVDGKKLYELARKGIEIERKAVKINIYELELLESRVESRESGAEALGPETRNLEPGTSDLELETWDLGLKVACSAGTYIRVLAEDIGKKVGTGAHLAELRRIRAGKFGIERSVTLERLEEIVAENNLEKVLISTNEAVSHLAEIKLSAEDAGRIKNGVKLKTVSDEFKDGEFLRLTEGENLLGIGFYREAEKNIQPKLVLV